MNIEGKMMEERLPILSKGAQEQGSGRVCAEQAVAWLAGEDWTDRPKCVQPVLNTLAIEVNDKLPDDRRGDMWPLILRQPGTVHPEMEPVLSVRLAAFLARKVLHLVHPEDRDVCEKAIEAAEVWCECPCVEHAEMACKAGADFYASYTPAAYSAYDDAFYASHAAAYASAATYKGVSYASHAAAYASAALKGRPDDLLMLLSDTQDEVERLTGHVPWPVDWERMRELLEMQEATW